MASKISSPSSSDPPSLQKSNSVRFGGSARRILAILRITFWSDSLLIASKWRKLSFFKLLVNRNRCLSARSSITIPIGSLSISNSVSPFSRKYFGSRLKSSCKVSEEHLMFLICSTSISYSSFTSLLLILLTAILMSHCNS